MRKFDKILYFIVDRRSALCYTLYMVRRIVLIVIFTLIYAIVFSLILLFVLWFRGL